MKKTLIIYILFLSLLSIKLNGRKKFENYRIKSKLKINGSLTTGLTVVNNKVFMFTDNEELVIANMNIFPRIVRRIKIHSICDSVPVYHKGIIYFGIYHQRIFGINVNTFKFDFLEFFHSMLIMQNSIIISEGFIYFAGVLGGIFKVDLYNGKVAWYKEIDANVWTKPGLYKNVLIIADEGGKITAINTNTGKVIWKKYLKTLRFTIGRVYITGNKFIVNSHEGSIIKFSVRNGYEYGRPINIGRIAYKLSSRVVIAPQRVNNIVYYPTQNDLIGVDINKFKKVFKFNTGNLPMFIAYKKGLYVNKDNILYSLDINGKIRWKVFLDSRLVHKPAIDKNFIYAMTISKTLYKIKR